MTMVLHVAKLIAVLLLSIKCTNVQVTGHINLSSLSQLLFTTSIYYLIFVANVSVPRRAFVDAKDKLIKASQEAKLFATNRYT